MSVMTVIRVHTEHGSRPEPPLDQSWDDLTKLQWLAALTEHESGIALTVTPGGIKRRTVRGWRDVPGIYAVSYRTSGRSGSFTGYPFDEAWALLTGISAGAELAFVKPEAVAS